MARSRRSSVQKYHDRVAGRYDDSYRDPYWQWHDRLTWDYLRPFLPRRTHAPVVDLGCGTGKWTLKLAKSGFDVTGVDISRKMLDQVERKAKHLGGDRGVQLLQADLCDLSELPAGRFELAVALGDPVGCARSPRQAMKQIRRILTDDGVLVATFDNRLAAIEFYLQQGDSKTLAGFLRHGKTHWLTKDAAEQFEIHTFTPSGLQTLAREAGLALVEIVGKTVLPMRHFRGLLDDADARRRWAEVEKSQSRDPAAIGRASHLQAVFRRLAC